MTLVDYYLQKSEILESYQSGNILRSTAQTRLEALQREALTAGLPVSGETRAVELLESVDESNTEESSYEDSYVEESYESSYEDSYC